MEWSRAAVLPRAKSHTTEAVTMFLIRRIEKRAAVKSYVTELPAVIKKRHGKHKKYPETQLTDCVKSAGLNLAHIDYALAIYMGRKEYETLRRKHPSFGDYDRLRKEVAKRFFKGNSRFNIHDLLHPGRNGAGTRG